MVRLRVGWPGVGKLGRRKVKTSWCFVVIKVTDDSLGLEVATELVLAALLFDPVFAISG